MSNVLNWQFYIQNKVNFIIFNQSLRHETQNSQFSIRLIYVYWLVNTALPEKQNFSFNVNPLNFKLFNPGYNEHSRGSTDFSPIKIGGISVQGFMSYDRTDKQRLLLYIYRYISQYLHLESQNRPHSNHIYHGQRQTVQVDLTPVSDRFNAPCMVRISG